jgi:hypothetical protein
LIVSYKSPFNCFLSFEHSWNPEMQAGAVKRAQANCSIYNGKIVKGQ